MSSIFQLFLHHAKQYPGHPFLVYRDDTISYEQAQSLAGSFAARLQQEKIQPGQYVGLLLNNHPALIISCLTLYSIGAIPVIFPISGRLSQFIQWCNRFNIQHLIYDEIHRNAVRQCEVQLQRNFLKLTVANNPAADEQDYYQWLTPCSALTLFHNPLPDQIALVMFTAGTNADPRAVFLTHHNLTSAVEACADHLINRHPPRLLLTIPMQLAFTQTVCINTLIQLGGTIIFPRSSHTEEIAKTLISDEITCYVERAWIFPEIIKHLPAGQTATQLKRTFAYGGNLSEDVADQWEQRTGCRLLRCYGTTETCGVATIERRYRQQPASALGPTIDHCEIAVLSPQGARVKAGQMGEICLSAPFIAPSAINHSSGDKRWFATGDLALLDSDSTIHLTGKVTDVILRYGYLIHPQIIESIVQQIPGIRVAAAIGVPFDSRKQQIILYIIPQTDSSLSEDIITEELKNRLPLYLMPEQIVMVQELPCHESGEIRRASLKNSNLKEEHFERILN